MQKRTSGHLKTAISKNGDHRCGRFTGLPRKLAARVKKNLPGTVWMNWVISLPCPFVLDCSVSRHNWTTGFSTPRFCIHTQTLHFNVLVILVEITCFNSQKEIRIDHRNTFCKPPKVSNTCLHPELSFGNQQHLGHYLTSMKRKLNLNTSPSSILCWNRSVIIISLTVIRGFQLWGYYLTWKPYSISNGFGYGNATCHRATFIHLVTPLWIPPSVEACLCIKDSGSSRSWTIP